MVDEVYIVVEEIENISLVIEETENISLVIEDGVGPRGFSAYEIAVMKGFIGTEQEWLDSLKSDITISATEPGNPYLNQLWIQTN
jgi:hypothetical protein